MNWRTLLLVWAAARLLYLAAAGGVPGLMFDEMWFLGKAARLAEGRWGDLSAWHGPVVYLGLAALLKAGLGLWAVRAFGLVWDALLVFGGTALVGRVAGPAVGRAWGLLAAVSPVVVMGSQHALTEYPAALGLLVGIIGTAGGAWGFAALGWLLTGLAKSGIGLAALLGVAAYAVWSGRAGDRRAVFGSLAAAVAGLGLSQGLSRAFWPSASPFSLGVYGPVVVRQLAESGLTQYAELLVILGGAPLAWWALGALRPSARPAAPGLLRLHRMAACLGGSVFLTLTVYDGFGLAYVALLIPSLALLAALRLGDDPWAALRRPVFVGLFAAQVAFAGLYEGSQTFGWRRIGDYLRALPVESVATLSRDPDHAAAFEAVARFAAGKSWAGPLVLPLPEGEMEHPPGRRVGVRGPLRVLLADDVTPEAARALARAAGARVALVPMYASNGLRHVVLLSRSPAVLDAALRALPPPDAPNTALPGERPSRIQADYLFHNFVVNPLLRLMGAAAEAVPAVRRFDPA